MPARLDKLTRLITGACRSAYDAHADEHDKLHRNFIPSIAKRFSFPPPKHKTTEDSKILEDWEVHNKDADVISINIEDNLTTDESIDLALALLWLAEHTEARRES